MPDPKVVTDVVSDPSPDPNAVENPVEENAAQEPAPEEETPQSPETPAPEGVKEEGEAVDEGGVPYKNRFMEQKRKFDDLQSNLPQMIENAVANAIPKHQPTPATEPAYTKEELIRYRNSTDDPTKKTWAEIELEKLRDQGIKQTFDKQREEDRQTSKLEQEKRAAYNMVFKKYPAMFNADGTYNNSHPLTQKLARVYGSQNVFKSQGYGLSAAADIAFSEYVLETQPQLAKTTTKLKRQVKKLEKQTLIEGGGQTPKTGAKSEMQLAAEELARTGSKAALKRFNYAKLKAEGKFQ